MQLITLPPLITDTRSNWTLFLEPIVNPGNLVMQLLCLFQQVGERGKEGGRARENMNIPHLCSPTMPESYKKTFISKEKWRFVIVYDLVSKIGLGKKAGINFPKWHLMHSHGFWFLISLVFNWCHNSKSGPYFKKEERMKTLGKHTKWPKKLYQPQQWKKHVFLLNIVLVWSKLICQICLSHPHIL